MYPVQRQSDCVCPLHHSKSITLRLMPPDGWRKCVEQLDLRLQPMSVNLRFHLSNSCRTRRNGGGATIGPTGVGREQVCERESARADVGGPAGALVLRVGALRWIPPEPLGRLA